MSVGAAPETRKPAPGDRLELELTEIDERGRTLGTMGDYRVAVRGGVVGARVRAAVTRRRRARIEARLEEVLRPSPDQEPARCPHVASCGGCSFQELAYPAQLAAKQGILARVLAPLGAPLEPILACAEPWNYRNKMDFTFAAARWIEPGEPEDAEAGFALGLHARGHFHKVLDLRACEIAFAGAAPILTSVRALARALGLEPWDVRARSGLLKHFVLRKSWASGAILADLVTSAEAPEQVGPLAEELLARHPELTTLVQHVNPGVALVANGRLARIFRGSGEIEERLGGLVFGISAASFFQTNTPQAERLLACVRTAADLRPSETLFDLYCGCGVFALALAREVGAERVVGFELVESAVVDARLNATRNGLDGVRFVAGDLALTLQPETLALRALGLPAVCVVDPPRAGMHPKVLSALRLLAPRRVVYVSCNPRAALEDVRGLLAAGYRLRQVQPLDLFPHTPHVECVFVLDREGAVAPPLSSTPW
jgi:23S rRNA (uracil1939-C5)-methyltransferase